VGSSAAVGRYVPHARRSLTEKLPMEAIKIVSLTPCAVAHGIVEVWPLEQA
jgi:hypothetical protein